MLYLWFILGSILWFLSGPDIDHMSEALNYVSFMRPKKFEIKNVIYAV